MNNVIIFGVKQSETNRTDSNKLDKIAVINIFKEIGINIDKESVEVIRLIPKRENSFSYPILVKVTKQNPNVSSKDILKAAKKLNESKDYKKIAISADLFVEERMVQKKLIYARKELNKELREKMPP